MTSEIPEPYKLRQVGQYLRREADQMQGMAEDIVGADQLAAKAMTLTESANLKEVGDWLVQLSGL